MTVAAKSKPKPDPAKLREALAIAESYIQQLAWAYGLTEGDLAYGIGVRLMEKHGNG